MARKTSVRVVINRAALDAVQAGYVDAFEDMGQRFVALIDPPDATPFGEGLVTTPDWGVWANGKKVAGTAAKPRGIRAKDGVTFAFGVGFPGRFQELGTIHQPPRPFETPVMNQLVAGAEGYISPPVRARLAGVR